MRVILAFLLLAACAARPLTEAELAFSDTVLGPALDPAEVRITRGAVVGLLPATVKPKPRDTCRSRLSPPLSKPRQGTFPAMAIEDTIFYTRKFWRDDFLKGYPEEMDLREAMRLAHELTHAWQWQARELTGYHPLRASMEHIEKDDPYLVDIDPGRRFLDYGYEQQGVIIEEFVCCRALDPDAPRTEMLHGLVTQVFPAAARRIDTPQSGIRLKWEGVKTEGICRTG